MTWSYDPTNLITTTVAGRVNIVRLLTGDTDTSDQQLADEEVTFALDESADDVYYAAAWCASTIYAKYSRLVSTEIDGALRSDYSDLASNYKMLELTLRDKAKSKSGKGLGSAGGGLTVSEIETNRDNTSLVQPSFTRDKFRTPGNDYTKTDYDQS